MKSSPTHKVCHAFGVGSGGLRWVSGRSTDNASRASVSDRELRCTRTVFANSDVLVLWSPDGMFTCNVCFLPQEQETARQGILRCNDEIAAMLGRLSQIEKKNKEQATPGKNAKIIEENGNT